MRLERKKNGDINIHIFGERGGIDFSVPPLLWKWPPQNMGFGGTILLARYLLTRVVAKRPGFGSRWRKLWTLLCKLSPSNELSRQGCPKTKAEEKYLYSWLYSFERFSSQVQGDVTQLWTLKLDGFLGHYLPLNHDWAPPLYVRCYKYRVSQISRYAVIRSIYVRNACHYIYALTNFITLNLKQDIWIGYSFWGYRTVHDEYEGTAPKFPVISLFLLFVQADLRYFVLVPFFSELST